MVPASRNRRDRPCMPLAVVAPTAVISGRSLEDHRPRVDGIPRTDRQSWAGRFACVGAGHATGHGLLPRLAQDGRRAERELTRAGVVVEDKMYSLTFHYRQACSPPAAREAIFHTVSTLSPVPRLVMGKAVVNAISGNPARGQPCWS